jgi:hypothetical protein
MTYLFLHLIPIEQEEREKRGTTSTFNWLIFDILVVIPTQRWQSATPNYYIPKTIIPSRSTPVGGCYTFKLVLVLNPTTTNLKLEHNQLFN